MSPNLGFGGASGGFGGPSPIMGGAGAGLGGGGFTYGMASKGGNLFGAPSSQPSNTFVSGSQFGAPSS